MRKLIVALIVLTPFIGVGQNGKDLPGFWHCFDYRTAGAKNLDTPKIWHIKDGYLIQGIEYPKPDTLSAYLLITTRHMGIAYQRRGFVVRQYGNEDVYLDCDKRVLKAPFNVWSFRIINQPK